MSKKRFLIVASVVALVIGTNIVTYATTSIYHSKGRIEYDANGNGVLTDDVDVVFDSRDIETLDTKIDTTATTLNTGLEDLQNDVDSLTESLGGLQFGYDETTQKYGYYVTDSEGADTFNPFKSGVMLESGQMFMNNTVSEISGNTIVFTRDTRCGVCMFVPNGNNIATINVERTNCSKAITVWYDDGTATSATGLNNIAHSINQAKTISLVMVTSNYMDYNDSRDITITWS